MCEADERNQRAVYELRGMCQAWTLDIPRIIQLLTGDNCQHDEPTGSIFLPENKGET